MNPEALKTARKRLFRSAQDLADALGVNRVTVANWEIGKSDPSLDMLRRVANTLGVSVSYLLGESPDFQPAEHYDFELAPYARLRDRAHREAPSMTAEQRIEAVRMIARIIEKLTSEDLKRYDAALHEEMSTATLELHKHRKDFPLEGKASPDFTFAIAPYVEMRDFAARDGRKMTISDMRETVEMLGRAMREFFVDLYELHPEVLAVVEDNIMEIERES